MPERPRQPPGFRSWSQLSWRAHHRLPPLSNPFWISGLPTRSSLTVAGAVTDLAWRRTVFPVVRAPKARAPTLCWTRAPRAAQARLRPLSGGFPRAARFVPWHPETHML